MLILIPILIFCFIIFLYNLYISSSDDFIIAKEDISMQKIFNLAFLIGFFALISSRFFFILFNLNSKFLSLIGFFALTYYPGLSLIGAVIGSVIFIAIFSKTHKYPTGKIEDIFVRSFLGVMPIGFFLIFVASLAKTSLIFNILFISYFILSLALIKPLYRLSEKGEIKDGSFSLIFLSIFSFIYFITRLFVDINHFNFFNLENIVLFVTIFVSLILLINQEVIEKMLEKK